MDYENRTTFRIVESEHGFYEVWYGDDHPLRQNEAAFVDRKQAERYVLREALGE